MAQIRSVLLTKEGFTITARQAQSKIQSLRKAKARDPELFELNGGSLDLLQLYQHIQQTKKMEQNPQSKIETMRVEEIVQIKNSRA